MSASTSRIAVVRLSSRRMWRFSAGIGEQFSFGSGSIRRCSKIQATALARSRQRVMQVWAGLYAPIWCGHHHGGTASDPPRVLVRGGTGSASPAGAGAWPHHEHAHGAGLGENAAIRIDDLDLEPVVTALHVLDH